MNRLGTVLFASVVVCAVVLQSTVLPVYLENAFRPDLLLIIMVFVALRGSFETGIPLSWTLGLFKDVFSGLYLGLNAFTFLIIFLIIKSVAERLYAESAFLFVITVCVATVICVSADFLLLLMFTKTQGIAATIGVNIIPHLLINAFAASLFTLLPRFFSVEEIP
jgi:rod shape-determining protein MreD